MSLVKELVLTCTKKRDGLNRGMLWSCLVVLSFFTMIIKGSSNIDYLFANAKLGWNIVQYSIFSGMSMVVSIIGTFGGLKIMKDYMSNYLH